MNEFLGISILRVPDEGSGALTEAFQARMGAVESWPGFRGLTVARSTKTSTDDTGVAWREFVMLVRFDTRDAYDQYMISHDHRASHARIPGGDTGPRPVRFIPTEVVA